MLTDVHARVGAQTMNTDQPYLSTWTWVTQAAGKFSILNYFFNLVLSVKFPNSELELDAESRD